MDLNKHQGNGMGDWATSSLKKSLRGKVDKMLFIKNSSHNILIMQVYVDDIIFGSTNKSLCEDFVHKMQEEFEMSMMGELNYFLGLQLK